MKKITRMRNTAFLSLFVAAGAAAVAPPAHADLPFDWGPAIYLPFTTTLGFTGGLAAGFGTIGVISLGALSIDMVQKVEYRFTPSAALAVLQNGNVTDEFLADKAAAEGILKTQFSSNEEAATAILMISEQQAKAGGQGDSKAPDPTQNRGQ